MHHISTSPFASKACDVCAISTIYGSNILVWPVSFNNNHECVTTMSMVILVFGAMARMIVTAVAYYAFLWLFGAVPDPA